MANILFITDLLPVGGTRTFFFNLSNELHIDGHRLFFVGFTENDEKRSIFNVFQEVCLFKLKCLQPSIFSLRFFYLYLALKKILNSTNIEYILVDLIFPSYALLFLTPFFSKHLRKAKIVYQFHGLDSFERSFTNKSLERISISNIKYFFRSQIDRYLLNNLPNKIVVFSRYSHSLLVQFGITNKIELILPGIDKELQFSGVSLSRKQARAALGLSNKKKIALIVSRLEDRKGVVSFFQKFPSKKSHNLQFLIVSDFANESNAYRLFASLNAKNLGSDVFIISRPLRHQLGLIYKAANVTIMTSLDLETFGFTTLESLSVKTPVIGYDIGANSELIEQNYLVSVEHPEQIYNKLFEFIESKKKSVISFNVKNYNWSNYAKKLINDKSTLLNSN